MKFLVVSKKKWNSNNFLNLPNSLKFSKKINSKILGKIKPKIIFFIHWSEKIPSKIYKKYLCIQFHSSNLPKFRGGAPIQNQILRNVKFTKISAFQVAEKIDSGGICYQKGLSLKGNAEEIYIRIEKICISMINKLIKMKKIKFIKQRGKVSYFKRRKPEESNLNNLKNLTQNKVYDFIRMLDAPDYPNAYITLDKFKILFRKISMLKNKELRGEFKIVKK